MPATTTRHGAMLAVLMSAMITGGRLGDLFGHRRLFAQGTLARSLAWYSAAAGLGSIASQVLGGLLVRADVAGLGAVFYALLHVDSYAPAMAWTAAVLVFAALVVAIER
jgi:hypothetical protein